MAQLLHGLEWDAAHDEVAGEGVAERVPADGLKGRALARPQKGPLQFVGRPHPSGGVAENKVSPRNLLSIRTISSERGTSRLRPPLGVPI